MPLNRKGQALASTLDRDHLTALVEDVLATPAASRKRVVNTVIEYLVTTNTLDMWTEALSNQVGYHDINGREDVGSVIAEKLLVTLHAAQAGTTQRVTNWAGFLYGLSKNAVLDYLASGQVTVASGMSSATRRQTVVGVTRRKLVAELGREPSRAEIIERANSHITATRSNPKKQGALITEADFDHSTQRSADVEDQFALTTTHGATKEIEDRAEVAVAARKLSAIASELYPDYANMGAFMETWMHLNLTGERASLAALAEGTGMSKASTKQYFDALEVILERMRALTD